MTSLILRPEKWVQGGFTLAHAPLADNARPTAIFVHGALPGETVEASIVRERAGTAYARAERVIELAHPLSERIDSDCPIFPACGGCSFRHLPYETEVRIKVELLREMRHLTTALDAMQTFTAPPSGYRQVARLHRTGGHTGFHAIWSETLLPLPEGGCRHLAPQINDAILHGAKHDAPGDELSLYLSHDGTVITSDAPSSFAIDAGDFSWQYRPGLFVQANRFLVAPWLAFMRDHVSALAAELSPQNKTLTCLELFCGTGLIGAAIARHLSAYTGIESSAAAIEQARANFANRLAHENLEAHQPHEPTLPSPATGKRPATTGLKTRFRVADLYQHPERLQPPSALLWVVNPPRGGLKEGLCKQAGRSSARAMVYSSCNPHTLDRDIAVLARFGFELHHLGLFDFFPRTPHVELVAVLKRVGRGPT